MADFFMLIAAAKLTEISNLTIKHKNIIVLFEDIPEVLL
jgi:hypothetical protein